MSSIAISVASLVAGMLWNKVLDHATNKLKDGDPTDEKCRQIIARELDDIKSKLDGLARKDLLSSVSFLGDGICLLNLSTQSSKGRTDESDTSCGQKMDVDHQGGGGTVECSGDDPMHSELTSVFNGALLLPMLPNVAGDRRFVDARASFEKAYTKATEAFNNEALSTEDRILATKLRVISRILERLEDPDSSAAFCKLYLQELHDITAVRKTFSTYFRSGGGVKSRFRKTKRAQNVCVVMMINYVLFDYAKKFTKMKVDDIFGWPRIKLAKRTIHPLMLEPDVLSKMERAGVHAPNQFRFRRDNEKWAENATVNSKGEIIVKSRECERFDVINNKGEIRFSFCPVSTDQDTKAADFETLTLTTDEDDNVYIVSRFKPNDGFYHYKLSVLDADGILERQFPLESFTGPGERHHTVCVAVNKDRDIFITKQDEARVFVFDSTGQLKHSFVIEAWHLIKHLSILDENEIIAAELVGKTVGIYTVKGALKRSIETPELHKVCGLAYHHASKAILVLTEVMPACFNVYLLESYSAESGELQQTLPLPGKRNEGYKIISHPSGTVVLLHKMGAIFIY